MISKKKKTFCFWRKPKSRKKYTRYKRGCWYKDGLKNDKTTVNRSSKTNLKTKWNRTHMFLRRKSSDTVGHPVYVYAKTKRAYKYLTFTHTPQNENDFEKLKHNIDPDKDGIEDSYVKKQFEVNRYNAFELPQKNYRIHEDDKAIIKKYQK